jgi:isopentenyl-diphosphate delta-isomerase
MPFDNQQEMFDICDAEDRVIGQATRGEVHALGLLHRAVHIWVYDSSGRLLVHRRSKHKDEYPLRYTSSASGHLSTGEDYATAAVRELEEELGLKGVPEFVLKLPASPETAREHTALYRIVSDETPSPDPTEIESIAYWTPTELSDRISHLPNDFSPPFVALWQTLRNPA